MASFVANTVSGFLREKKARDTTAEEQDSQDAISRGQREQVRDWPNEAGVCPANGPKTAQADSSNQFQALHEETTPVKLGVTGSFPKYTQSVSCIPYLMRIKSESY